MIVIPTIVYYLKEQNKLRNMKFKLNKQGIELYEKIDQLFELQTYFGLKVDYDGECNEIYNIADFLRQLYQDFDNDFTKADFILEYDSNEEWWMKIYPYIEMVRPLN